jgi:hypothetical protein
MKPLGPTLRDDELRLETGRCEGGDGGFLRLVHSPTGISRSLAPVGDAKRRELTSAWREEIEAELLALGLAEYVLPGPPKPFYWREDSMGRRLDS